jgi:L-serine dehydratase
VTTSIFDLFKPGIGPSSSHTVGPMRAAQRFASGLADLARVERVRVELFGSLALTGRGHGTDRAVMLGLEGEGPQRVDPEAIGPALERIRATRRLRLGGSRELAFDEATDLVFRAREVLPHHSNGMRFTALGEGGTTLECRIFYSIGGGFITEEGEQPGAQDRPPVPYPFKSAEELLERANGHGLAIWELVLENESAWRPRDAVLEGVRGIWAAMEDCIRRGLRTEGILPGGLDVARRAPSILAKLREGADRPDPFTGMDWVSLYAIAVNEENAAGGRVVTAPTNGAAGVIPAVGQYFIKLHEGRDEGLVKYLLTAGAIGVLYKENASISGAEVGCQGEVGVAASMAAAGLTAALGGTNEEVEHAAEIAMEHHLGMTCDPVGGLVQIPCIERNAFGAVKAINAARMALRETGSHKVSLDQVIRTMFETGKDMQSRYKETSLAGLAIHVNTVEC